jgi:hypothetical protein
LFIDPRGLTGRRQSWLIAHFQRNLTKPDKVGGIVANNTLRGDRDQRDPPIRFPAADTIDASSTYHA